MHGKIDLEIKITLVGDSGTGKTSLVHAYVENQFPSSNILSKCENKTTYARFRDKVVKLEIRDTVENDKFENGRLISYSGADIFVICFCLNKPESFNKAISKWISQIQEYNADALKMLVCTRMDTADNELNKIDFSKKPCLPYFIIQRKIEALGIPLSSCSAKSYQGVQETFTKAISLVCYKNFGEEFSQSKMDQCRLI